MVTDQLIQKRFITDTMTAGISKIYEIQESVVNSCLNKRSGDLSGFLSRKPFTSTAFGSDYTYYMRIFPYLRFLDINYRKSPDRISKHIRSKLALYNRSVWGVLYHETFPDLRYGLSEDIRRGIKEQLESALTE
ncbi:MAG: hypothetical protein EOM76_05290 [Sphingobacteriia bacterium]|nr:hypothetical protein [Sphingobacteriia bacterium]